MYDDGSQQESGAPQDMKIQKCGLLLLVHHFREPALHVLVCVCQE